MLAVRLVTSVDVADPAGEQVSVAARHEVELADGRRVLLLDDRGWSASVAWAAVPLAEIEETTRVVVGPDEPPDGRSPEDMAADHWSALQEAARRQGLVVAADELRRLPHDVVLGPRVLARRGGADHR